VSVITFDDPPAAAQIVPPLTAIRQPVPLIGHRAVERLVELTAGGKVAQKERMSTELIVRSSVRSVV
ncbi:LacI family transcriptional regulator, partial [bacterium]